MRANLAAQLKTAASILPETQTAVSQLIREAAKELARVEDTLIVSGLKRARLIAVLEAVQHVGLVTADAPQLRGAMADALEPVEMIFLRQFKDLLRLADQVTGPPAQVADLESRLAAGWGPKECAVMSMDLVALGIATKAIRGQLFAAAPVGLVQELNAELEVQDE